MTKSAQPTNTTVGHLKKALKRVTGATGAKSASLAVDEKGLRVEAATPEGYASVHVSITGEAGKPCAAQISANLVNIILSGEDADTTLTVDGDSKGARIRYAGANLLLRKPDICIEDLFTQSYRSMGSTPITTLTGAELRAAAGGAAHFMARRDIRHYLCGVHMLERNGKLEFEGTDGFSMHQNKTDHPLLGAQNLDVIIPVHAAEAMVSVFDDNDVVSIEKVGDTLIGFRTSETYWVTNIVSAKFPDCSHFFDTEEQSGQVGVTVVLNRKSMVSALKRVSSVAQREGNYVRIAFADKGVTVSSTDAEQLDVINADKVFNLASGSIDCALTTSVALNVFDGVPTEHLVLRKGNDPMGKLFIRPAIAVNGEWQFDSSWQALLMPAKI